MSWSMQMKIKKVRSRKCGSGPSAHQVVDQTVETRWDMAWESVVTQTDKLLRIGAKPRKNVLYRTTGPLLPP